MKSIYTDKLPMPKGPYSHAVLSNGMIFTSGQLPFYPGTEDMEIENLEVATKNCLLAIENIAKIEGKELKDCISIKVYLTDMNDYGLVNDVYKEMINFDDMPARTLVEVSKLPMGSKIEVEAIIKL